jgi:hypothetical protein
MLCVLQPCGAAVKARFRLGGEPVSDNPVYRDLSGSDRVEDRFRVSRHLGTIAKVTAMAHIWA